MGQFVFVFGPDEATLLIGFLTSVVVPFVVSLIAKPDMPKGQKLAIAILVSTVGGFLTTYAAGSFSGATVNPIVAGMAVFSAAQTWFASWFRGLGLDEALENIGA